MYITVNNGTKLLLCKGTKEIYQPDSDFSLCFVCYQSVKLYIHT